MHTFGPIHEHHDGPLGPLSGASFAFAPSDSGAWTSGYELCLEQGTDPVILESVSPVDGGGAKPNFLGAFVRAIPADSGGAIGTVRGFPPTVSETLHADNGYQVTQHCNFSQPTPARPTSYTELDVGIGRPSPFTGGGWSGFTVAYRVGSTQYVATWDTGLYMCGPTAPAASGCNQPS